MRSFARLSRRFAAVALLLCTSCNAGGSGSTLPRDATATSDSLQRPATTLLSSAAQSFAPAAQTTLFYDTFVSAANWTAQSGAWTICRSHTYCAAAASTPALTTAGNADWTDYEVDAWLAAAGPARAVAYGAAVVGRYQDAQNYYALELQHTAGAPLWSIVKVEAGVSHILKSGEHALTRAAYYHVRFVLSGSTLTAYATVKPNDTTRASETLLGSAVDATFSTGKIALVAMSATAASFQQVGVYSVASSAPSPTPAPGTLKLRIGGTRQGVDYDYLKVGGKATLGGILDIDFGNKPVSGQTYVLVQAAAGVTGRFSTIVSNGIGVTPHYGATSFSVTVN